MLRACIVDDQELVRTGFAMILGSEDDIDVVGQASNGREAVELCHLYRPDVVLMDVRMPEMDGIEATRLITASDDLTARVLILTTFDLDEYVYDAIRAGASGFLLKDTPVDDLVRAVRVVAAGEALLAPSVTRRLIEEFASETTAFVEAPGLADLTEREREVLAQMARGLSNQEIAAELFLGETTVKTHVSRVLTKLDVRDRVQAVIVAYESGIVRPGRGCLSRRRSRGRQGHRRHRHAVRHTRIRSDRRRRQVHHQHGKQRRLGQRDRRLHPWRPVDVAGVGDARSDW